MTVLLLASQERVQDLFRSLETRGTIELRIVSSITDAEKEMSQFKPDLAFIQSRISGLSADIVMRHIRNLLPAETKVVLLSGDEQEVQKARRSRAAAVSLAQSDEALVTEITELVCGRLPEAEAATLQAPQPVAAPGAAQDAEEPDAEVIADNAQEPEPEEEPDAEEFAAAAITFEQTLQNSLNEQGFHGKEPQPPSVEELLAAENREGAMPRQRRLLPLLIIVTLALGTGLFAAYVFLMKSPSPSQETEAPAKQEAAPAQRESAPPVQQGGAPAQEPPPHAAGEKRVPPPAPEKENAAQRAPGKAKGLTLPPFLAGAQLDAGYGASQPGWERYLVPDTEVKVFKEGALIKAIQVKATGEAPVAPGIASWARKEFEAAGAAKLEGKETEGNYEIEKWAGGGGAGLTLYRKLPESSIRALVLYYR